MWLAAPDRWGSTAARIHHQSPLGVDFSARNVDGSPEEMAWWLYMHARERLEGANVVVYRISGQDPVRVAKVYRTINIPGVPHSDEDMARFDAWVAAQSKEVER